jgi:hydrogenase maturation factor
LVDVDETLTTVISKVPEWEAWQPAGAEACGAMADVTAAGIGLAKAEAARASRV